MIRANCRAGMGERARVGLHCQLHRGGQSFTALGAIWAGYNDMDCLLAFVERKICTNL